MANFVGIDLGTTFSLLSVIDEDGTHEIKYDRERFLPSVVYFGNEITVGASALQALEFDSENVVTQIKKKMPQNNEFKLHVNGNDYSPEDVSSLILEKLIKDAEKKIGKITHATITIPNFYNDIAREATKNAAIKAGIENPSIISEPVAAGLYYSRTKNIGGKILVYDLGGGTLDCSVISIDGDKVEVLGSKGESFGGTDFDTKLFELLSNLYEKEKGQKISNNLEESRKKMQPKIEAYKKTLDFEKSVKGVINGDSGPLNFDLPSDEFHESLDEYIIKSEMILTSLLEELSIHSNEINEVVLVGGSTRMPLFQDHLKDFFKKDNITTAVNVDEIVCLGASIHCSIANNDIQTESQKNKVGNIIFSNVVNHFYGTINLDPAGKLVNTVIIKKNEKFPIEVTKEFVTASDADSLQCRVTQCEIETTELEPQEIISDSTLKDLGENRSPGQPVTVTFAIDSNQILKCTFKDLKTNKDKIIEKNLQKL